MISIAEEVAVALAERRPVVALESTIIAHGLPHPDNLELALELETTVREAGAVPATIGVIDGVARVGLTEAEIERFALPGSRAGKASASDLAAYVGAGTTAATTVSATAALAARVGIRLFATGGIGGVHRGDTGDVSCDLLALGREPVAVVSSGAKAILDLPRTLEALETNGVLVIGYRTAEFPAFYCRESGLSLEHRMDEPAEIAAALRARFDELGQGGVLVANPVPIDAALPLDAVEAAIDEGLERAAAEAVSGKQLTPFLLGHVAASVGREAILANRALARSNAGLAAAVATAYSAS